MKIVNSLIINSLGLFITYLAFAKDIMLFKILLYITMALAIIGVFNKDTYKMLLEHRWYQLVLMIPFIISNWWIGITNGDEVYTYISIMLNVVILTVLLNKKFKTTIY